MDNCKPPYHFLSMNKNEFEALFLLFNSYLPPVDCDVVDWSSWSECATTCGDGTETRNKNTTECQHHNETRPCNNGPCPGNHDPLHSVAYNHC